MSENEPKPLIVWPTHSLLQPGSGAEKVLSRIVSDALTVVRAHDIAERSARFRVGEYEFREPDFRQIAIWAREIGESSEALVKLLESREKLCDGEGRTNALVVDDGSIKEIQFPDNPIFMSQSLRIAHLPSLIKLDCGHNGLSSLELINVPNLKELYCQGNLLTKLDLSDVPALTTLDCAMNELDELDLSYVPGLTLLRCFGNAITKLDLSNIPRLTRLVCFCNALTDLDLSNVPALTRLDCGGNELTELDLSKVPELAFVNCVRNKLTQLDLSNNEHLVCLSFPARGHKGTIFADPNTVMCDTVVLKVWCGLKL